MLTATQAREKSESMNTVAVQTQLDKVEKAISSASYLGKFDTTVDFHLLLQVANHLKTLGYDVKADSHRNESYTYIGW